MRTCYVGIRAAQNWEKRERPFPAGKVGEGFMGRQLILEGWVGFKWVRKWYRKGRSHSSLEQESGVVKKVRTAAKANIYV